MKAVSVDREFRRIQALPHRNPLSEIECVHSSFSSSKLRPIQQRALAEIYSQSGAFVPVGVGHGKTLIALLAPRQLGAQRPVLLVDASLKKVVEQVEIPKYSRDFELPKWHAIISYNDLSNPKKANLLEELLPDAIIADEAHNLRHRTSIRVKRLARYFRTHPDTKFVALSGTMTAKSIKDYSHLAAWALREGSPVPWDYWTLEHWSAALDPNPLVPMEPGALMDLCGAEHSHETAREAFRCRMISTPGVVATEESSLGTSLVLKARSLTLNPAAVSALDKLRSEWVTPDGELVDVLAFHRIAQQLAFGFYYRAVWPNGKVDHEWVEARREWVALINRLVKYRSQPGMDSEALVTQAIDRGHFKLAGADQYVRERWRLKSKFPGPGREAVWLADNILIDIRRWVGETANGIIWYRDVAVGERVSYELDLPLYGANDGVRLAHGNSTNHPHIVVSIKAHSQGQNLQTWNHNLILGMCGGARFQQLLARTHRAGQEADVVDADIYQHTAELIEGFARAQEVALYIEQTTGDRQRLTFATKVGFK